jgi:acetyltransferase-like isoleucine patch superfamily enzyme
MAIDQGSNVYMHQSVRAYGRNRVGDDSLVLEEVILGHPTADVLLELKARKSSSEYVDYEGTHIGANAVIRSHAVFYRDVVMGHHVRTGHRVLVREGCRIGNHVLIGSNVVIDNNCTIGNNVSLQTNVYIPTGTAISDDVFMGPHCVILNDPFPIRDGSTIDPVVIERGVSVGGNATILPGVTLHEGCFVAAGAVVTKNVPPWHLAIGSPATFRELPQDLKTFNRIV